MSKQRRKLLAGLRITSFWTLTSRMLGMVRDMATAALLGLSTGGVMDAFVIAFRIPNLFRRLFGEGALAASYLPVLTNKLEHDKADASKLASVTLTLLALVLFVIVLLGEVLCGVLWFVYQDDAQIQLLLGLSAILLPYVLLVCLSAQVSATLHAVGRFGLPAFVPILLNISWITAAVFIAPFWSDKHSQAYILAASVMVGGFLQLGLQLPLLRAEGFRYDYDWAKARDGVRKIVVTILPTVIGLAVTQINTLLDSVIAWTLSAAPDGPTAIAWLENAVDYPMQQGATSAIFYGERLYHFPVGILGIAVATVIFPLLSRHAARKEYDRIGSDLTLGLRLVLFLAVPAAAGLTLLSEPIARLIFQRGEFSSDDAYRTGQMIAYYAPGVWAYCALPVLVRGFYSMGNHGTPVRVACWVVGLNLFLNLTLVWQFAEAGLAVSTAISASVQAIMLATIFSSRMNRLDWPTLFSTLARTLLATTLMTACGYAVLSAMPEADNFTGRLGRVLAPFVACLVVYLACFRLLRGSELRILSGKVSEDD